MICVLWITEVPLAEKPFPFDELDYYVDGLLTKHLTNCKEDADHQKNIDMTTINKTQYWWDSEVKRILKDHPSGYFSSLEIHNDFKPIFLYLRLTQRLHHTRIIRMVDKLISFLLPDPRKK